MHGTRIGHYQVGEKLGAGGMGEVYRATDTKLGRQVALKVLPEAFAQDPERMARFEREAQVLASLNHPNIAAIHRGGQGQGARLRLGQGPRGPARLDQPGRFAYVEPGRHPDRGYLRYCCLYVAGAGARIGRSRQYSFGRATVVDGVSVKPVV